MSNTKDASDVRNHDNTAVDDNAQSFATPTLSFDIEM